MGNEELVVIGVDPGLAATGFGVLLRSGSNVTCLDYGCVRTRQDEGLPARLDRIHSGIVEVITRWTPSLLVLEDAFVKNSIPSAALSIGMVRGVLMLAAYQHQCEVEDVPARVVKLAITGSGAADKSQIERVLRRRLSIPSQIRPDHAADALGLAYVGVTRR